MGQEFARRRRGFPALAGAASAVSFSPLPCEGRGGLGSGAFWIIRTVGTSHQPTPAFAGGGARALFRGNVLLAADPRHRQDVLLERLATGGDHVRFAVTDGVVGLGVGRETS